MNEFIFGFIVGSIVGCITIALILAKNKGE